jgi:hypothetical protein
MNITRRDGLSAKSVIETVRPETVFISSKSGALVPSGIIVDVTAMSSPDLLNKP